MKFRLQCANCNATFFSTDRRARYCPKCVNKRAGKPASVTSKPGPAPRPGPAGKPPAKRFEPRPARKPEQPPKPPKEQVKRPPKVKELTPELREQIKQVYEQQFAGSEKPLNEIIIQISDNLWVSRKGVSQVINKILNPDVVITPEQKARVIEMYKGYVERGERPERGRRNTIGHALGIPFRQVRDIVYEWSKAQYSASPTPELSREQKFEMEKIYWDELNKKRYRFSELPAKIAEQVGFASAYQVSRWLDMLYDDESKFANVADVPPETEQRILEAYRQYLSAPQPPEHGLHFTIASQVGEVNQRQVHKVLQRYRYRRRDEYPLK
jgi:hypothetical protein